MVLDGQPLAQIDKLLAVAVGTSSLSVHGVVQDSVARIISSLRCLFHATMFNLLLVTELFIVCVIHASLFSQVPSVLCPLALLSD